MGKSKSSSKTKESALSAEQLKILRKREEQYTQFFLPELLDMIQQAKAPGIQSAMIAPGVKAANTLYEQASQNLSTVAAQRGLSGSGFEASGLASLEAARADTITDAAMKGALEAFNKRSQLVQLGMGLAPQPTQSAQYLQTSSTQGSPFEGFKDLAGGLGALAGGIGTYKNG